MSIAYLENKLKIYKPPCSQCTLVMTSPMSQPDFLSSLKDEEVRRKVMESFMHNYRLVKCQLDSYNKFALKDLAYIIREQSPLVIKADSRCHRIEFGDVVIKSPMVQEVNGFVHNVTPSVARKRSLSYSAPVLVNICHTVYNHSDISKATQKKTHNYIEVLLFHLPVMVRSSLCSSVEMRSAWDDNGEDPMDEGGYFITNGNEKAVLAQESICNNYPFIFLKPSGSNRFSHCCEIRSLHEDKTRSTSTLTMLITAYRGGLPPSIIVNIPFINMHIPLPAVFKMLGVNNQDDMRHFIVGTQCQRYESIMHLVNAVLDSEDMNIGMKGDDLLDYIGREGTTEGNPDTRVSYIRHLINNELLPHMGMISPCDQHSQRAKDIRIAKAYFLGMAIRKLLLVYTGQISPDDRDNYADKRLATTGVSMALLFRQKLRKFISTVTILLKKSIDSNKHVNIVDTFHAKRITSGLNYALSTGNWNSKKGNKNQTGVAQILLRMSMPATISHLRRINSQLNRDGKLPKPRQLDPSHWGILCMSETPEGANCGLIKIMALGMQIRIGHSLVYVTNLIQDMVTSVDHISPESNTHVDQSMVLVNGVLVGFVQDPLQLTATLRQKRRCMNLAWDTTVLYDTVMDQVIINTDPGACLRPLFVVENLYKFPELYRSYTDDGADVRHLWRLLMTHGVVEFIDKKEEMTLDVALRVTDLASRHTHVDVHDMLRFGLCTAMIPFPDHNQGPRNMYQSCMGKQAVSVYCTNYRDRMDSVSYVLHYPQHPLVSTMIEKIIPSVHNLPTGVNLIVAIACYTGYNIEDSVIINQAAVDRGVLRCSTYRTYKESARGQGARINQFEKPGPDCIGLQDSNYANLDEDGLTAPGVRCHNNDVLIGNTTEMTVLGSNARGTRNNQVETPKRDNSTVYREDDDCVVDTVLISNNSNEGGRYVMTKTRRTCIPEIGDKVSSRHGQKGVIGLLMPPEDMPFTMKDGIVPDLIMNPHAFPSRMTIGQMMEKLMGKACAMEGKIGDGTPFQDVCMDDIHNQLLKHGMDAFGNEYMINGQTGKMMEEPVFIGMHTVMYLSNCRVGPVYYQRLKHMVSQKIHARATGPVQSMTRQPVEGRAKDGGLRFGEMERDALESHGASAVLKDRLMDQSDAFTTVYCETCGFLAESAAPKGDPRAGLRASKPWCRHCGRSDTVREINMPYAYKLFIQELGGLGIATRHSSKENAEFAV